MLQIWLLSAHVLGSVHFSQAVAEEGEGWPHRLKRIRAAAPLIFEGGVEKTRLHAVLGEALHCARDDRLLRAELLGASIFALRKARSVGTRRELLDFLTRNLPGQQRGAGGDCYDKAASVAAGKLLSSLSPWTGDGGSQHRVGSALEVIVRSPEMTLLLESMSLLTESDIVRILYSRDSESLPLKCFIIDRMIGTYVGHVVMPSGSKYVPLPRDLYVDTFAAIPSVTDEQAVVRWVRSLGVCFGAGRTDERGAIGAPHRVQFVSEVKAALGRILASRSSDEELKALCSAALEGLEAGIRRHDTKERRELLVKRAVSVRKGRRELYLKGGSIMVSVSPAHSALIETVIDELRTRNGDYAWDIWCEYRRMARVVDPIWFAAD